MKCYEMLRCQNQISRCNLDKRNQINSALGQNTMAQILNKNLHIEEVNYLWKTLVEKHKYCQNQ